MDQSGFEISNGNSQVGDEWTENQKGKRKENPADNVCGSLEKQDEYRRIPAYVEPSFEEAMERINTNILNFDLRESVFRHVSTPARQFKGVIYCVGNILIGLEVPWVKVLKETPLSELFDSGFPQIPCAFYETVVNWTQHFDGSILGAFVRWGSGLLLEDLVAVFGVGRKISHSRYSRDAIFIVLAIVLRSRPSALTAACPILMDLGQEKIHVKVIVWMIGQAFRDNVWGSVYTWAYCLLPLAACNPESRDLILQFIEMILSKSVDREILLDNSRAIILIQPSSFEMLVRLTFPASRVEGTERFEKIYPLLKRVALIAATEEEIRQIFTFSLKLAGEGNSSNTALAKEATSIGILCLEESFVDCCNHWDTIYKENLEASVALLQEMVHKWKDHSLKLSPSRREEAEAKKKKQITGQIFRFSLKFAAEGNPVLAKEAVSIAIWCLEESFVDCCDHWDNLYKENVEASVALLQELVHKWKDHSFKLSSLGRKAKAKAKEKKQVTEQIFRFSLKFAGEGNPVLAREATSIAMLCLTESFVDCCNDWDSLYKENLEASVALLQELVHKWKDHSLKLSSSGDTLDQTMKSFRLKNKEGITRGDNACLYKQADKYCKIILSRGSGKLDFTTAVVVAITGVALALVLILLHNVGIWE